MPCPVVRQTLPSPRLLSHSCCHCAVTALRCCTQGAINTAALSGVNSDNAELKHMVQQSGAENALGNHKASESLDCIVISDSDEESPDRRELLRNSSNTDSSEAPSAPGEPEDQTRNTSNDAAATLPAQPPGQRHLSSPNLRKS